MIISLSFSAGMYGMLSREVERFARSQRFRLENRGTTQNPPLPVKPSFFETPPATTLPDPDLVNEVKSRFLVFLGVINLAILGSAGILGYFLAGWTLKPIAIMVEEQNRFISDASHELKTPLTALKSSFEVFLREPKPDIASAKELIKDGVEDVDKLAKLASSLLEISRYTNANGKDTFVPTDIREVIQASVDNISPLARKAGIVIKTQVREAAVLGDRGKLVELCTILLDNAVKYSRKDGQVVVSAEKTDGHVVIKVQDEGVGISADDLPHIFDRFYRADLSRSQANVSGYGLGLAIAQEIVKTHGSTISAQSEIDKGTTMSFKLKAA